MGYTNVKDYPGGKKEWIDAGLPIEHEGEGDPIGACVDEEPEAPPG